ncbi:MAG TPA: GNA1162 family protein [Planctomycetota bacterium]|nr:GNA1162 family protein [Planctomycetota bacterium]
MSARALAVVATLLVLVVAAGCTTPRDFDYTLYLQHMPRSILVLPPLDDSPDVEGTYGCLAKVTRPLAERGYYVFPVAVVDAMLRENGLPTPGEMHQVSLKKLDEIFAADAVLYLTVRRWGTSYQVLNSATTVTIDGSLVDVKSGIELWRGSATAQENSGGGGQGLAGALVGALVHQVVTSSAETSRNLAGTANFMLYHDAHAGLLEGAYWPEYEAAQKQRRQAPVK